MIKKLCMTGFYSGFSPFASGTAGSAVAAAIALGVWAVLNTASVPAYTLDTVWIVLVLISTIGCGVWGDWAIAHLPARKEGDPGAVVLDEFAGQWIALIALPMATLPQALIVLAGQFFLFRFFDVFKPPPARQLEKLHGGWGIVADDLAAGIYANLVGQLFFRWVMGY